MIVGFYQTTCTKLAKINVQLSVKDCSEKQYRECFPRSCYIANKYYSEEIIEKVARAWEGNETTGL